MARIGILCPPLHSHLHLNATLGRALRRRGHNVFLFQLPALREKVESLGVEFFPLHLSGRSGQEELLTNLAKLGQLSGLSALRFTLDCARQLADLICRAAPEAVRDARADLLLVDQNEPAGGSVAEHLALPFVSVCSGLPLNREPLVPPAVTPWSYSKAWWARYRNALGYAVFDRLVAPVNAALNEHRSRWNLRPVRRPDDTFSRLAQLCPLVEEFDFPRERKPENLHYVGPFDDGERSAAPFPYELLDGRPLVYASLGTIHNWTERSLRAVAEAVVPLNAQLVASRATGIQLTGGPLPESPILVDYAPQRDLLARASLCITHAGLNTIIESLGCGTPIVAVPITNDQPPNAARVVWTGTGESLPYQQMQTRQFRALVKQVFEQPSYRENARRLQTALRKSGGVEAAATLTEGLL